MPAHMLPIGIQTFATLREQGCYYVDKTPHIARLAAEGGRYFLSRPRRFGKSLLLDTIKELFEGNRALFEGLAAYDAWDWDVCHPVLRLSFGTGHFATAGNLHASAMAQLRRLEECSGLPQRQDTAPERFGDLIERLHQRSDQRVVVLVDEYDKPITDALDAPDVAAANRDYLRGLYGAIKDCDAHIRLAFITGVTKFAKVGLFSGLNNLIDLTLDAAAADICGYTEADLDATFGAELAGLDRDRIREWYNGYNWLGEPVYNPFDVLLLLRQRRFRAHWFETGSPRFAIDLLTRRQVRSVDLDGLLATDDLLSAFDVEHIGTEALLFQTGYLTIVAEECSDDDDSYRLGYPNREVRQSFNRSLLGHWAQDDGGPVRNALRLRDLLRAADFAGMESLFHAFFASIPHQWYANNDIARFEGFYASVFYSHFAAAGLDVVVEDSSSRGRVDMAVRSRGGVYLFEFKVLERSGEGAALAQLRDRRYADKYRADEVPIHLVGVEFSEAARNVARVDVERA